MAPYSTLTRVGGNPDSPYSTLTAVYGGGVNNLSSTLTRVIGMTAGTLGVDAGAPLTTDAFDSVTLAAAITGTPTSILWELLNSDNPRVTAANCVPDDPTAVTTFYWAPPTVNGVKLTWRVTASIPGQPSASDTVVHTIRNHAGPWIPLGSGQYQGIQTLGNYGPDYVPS